ncbi:hypothetical protein PT287_05830 [Lactobacillus sp. ESL0679]|uniref:hypothetical protein n=1 Tax=Lactobacillus sp. ESL0679 TaxID=2983209 RepID=UPI0023F72C18|nr:hypothetical protein [Lactobacillus sp. ESL0679]MDF7683043.1 hypothetical protein [Lactobacillus sp. ESL0679]
MDKNTKQPIEKLAGQNSTNNTVSDVAMTDDDWLDKAAKKVNVVFSGDIYVKLKSGKKKIAKIPMLTNKHDEYFVHAIAAYTIVTASTGELTNKSLI